jgi:hypothetical protein
MKILWALLGLGILGGGLYFFYGPGAAASASCPPLGIQDQLSLVWMLAQKYLNASVSERLAYINMLNNLSEAEKRRYLEQYWTPASPNIKCRVLEHLRNNPTEQQTLMKALGPSISSMVF